MVGDSPLWLMYRFRTDLAAKGLINITILVLVVGKYWSKKSKISTCQKNETNNDLDFFMSRKSYLFFKVFHDGKKMCRWKIYVCVS